MMTSTPTPGVTDLSGAAKAPAKPPKAVATPKTSVMVRGTLTPIEPSISRSRALARAMRPGRVRDSMSQAKTTTISPMTMMAKL